MLLDKVVSPSSEVGVLVGVVVVQGHLAKLVVGVLVQGHLARGGGNYKANMA